MLEACLWKGPPGSVWFNTTVPCSKASCVDTQTIQELQSCKLMRHGHANAERKSRGPPRWDWCVGHDTTPRTRRKVYCTVRLLVRGSRHHDRESFLRQHRTLHILHERLSVPRVSCTQRARCRQPASPALSSAQARVVLARVGLIISGGGSAEACSASAIGPMPSGRLV